MLKRKIISFSKLVQIGTAVLFYKGRLWEGAILAYLFEENSQRLEKKLNNVFGAGCRKWVKIQVESPKNSTKYLLNYCIYRKMLQSRSCSASSNTPDSIVFVAKFDIFKITTTIFTTDFDKVQKLERHLDTDLLFTFCKNLILVNSI